jgi:hypothetical protein
MKNETQQFQFFQRFKIQPLCESIFQSSIFWSAWQSVQRFVPVIISLLTHHVRQGLSIGLAAFRAHAAVSKYLVGDVFIVLGVFGLFLHQFFSPTVIDKDWYYLNWFYFLYAIRLFTVMLFLSVAAWLYSSKHSGLIFFVVIHCAAWLGVIHHSFFVYDFKSYHAVPIWQAWVIAASFGTGFLLAVNHLVYVWEHKIKGNHKRFVMLAEHGDKIDPETRQRMLSDNLNEYRNLYKNY